MELIVFFFVIAVVFRLFGPKIKGWFGETLLSGVWAPRLQRVEKWLIFPMDGTEAVPPFELIGKAGL